MAKNIVKRSIQSDIENKLFKGKIIVIYGPRQVGKTTLIKEIQKKYPNSAYFNCDVRETKDELTDISLKGLESFLGKNKLVFLDEAQRVENIGLTLKIAVDTFPDTQIVATGSSSFELSNKIIEPLTGRKYEFFLYPFSIEELIENNVYQRWEVERTINKEILLSGFYPEVTVSGERKSDVAKRIVRDYLFKDILQFSGIKNSEMVEKLLQALAMQAGSEVSYTELSNLLQIDKVTVASYVRILEQNFIIFHLRPLHRNLRTELRKLRKIYFFDNGIRNALINNFNPINIRNDIGALWENFLISERLKYNGNHGIDNNIYFWRTHQKQEIDYIEEAGGKLSGFEFKWNKGRFHKPKAFMEGYSGSDIQLINKENFLDFVAGAEV